MSETLVNTFTAGFQGESSVVALADGGWVVTWLSDAQDGSLYGIYQQRFNADGTTSGEETLVNSYTSNSQDRPVVSALDDGGWVVAWMSAGADTWNYAIEFQRFDSAGVAAGSETQANIYYSDNQIDPSIATLADGNFIVTWTSYGQDGDGNGIYQRVFASNGAAAGSEVLVNTTTAANQEHSCVTALSGGGWVVTWASEGGDGSSWGVYQQRYNSDGSTNGGQVLVNSYTTDSQSEASVTSLADGGWLVTWVSSGQDGSYDGIYQRRYGSDGVATGLETLVNTTTFASQSTPSVSALDGGGWVVVWTTYTSSGGNEIYFQAYDADGNAFGGERQANAYSTGSQTDPFVTALADGGFVITWTSANQDGSDGGIYQQRYDADGILYGHVNAPVAESSTFSGFEDMATNFSYSQFQFSDADADTLYSVTIVSLPTNGELLFKGAAVTEGTVLRAGDIWQLTYRAGLDQSGQAFDSFEFKVTDYSGKTSEASATMSIDVEPIDDGLLIVPDTATMLEGGRLVADVLANDSDPDGNPISIKSAKVESGNASVKIRDDGKLAVTYSGRDLDPGEQATVTISYKASDGSSRDASTLTVTVTGIAEPGDDIKGTAEGETLIGTDQGERIFGRGGNDVLNGKGGSDRIDGGAGNDTLQGGGGADTFVFKSGYGNDTIGDFQASGKNGDVIDLSSISAVKDYDDLVSHHLKDRGHDVVIAIDRHNSIRIEGIDPGDLKEGDFLF